MKKQHHISIFIKKKKECREAAEIILFLDDGKLSDLAWLAGADIFKTDKKSFLSLSQAPQVVPVVKNPPANAGDIRDVDSILGSRRSSGGQPTSVFLSGESPGQRSLAGYSLQSLKESDLACIHACIVKSLSLGGPSI